MQGFDFGRWISEGMDYCRLCHHDPLSETPAQGLELLFQEIIKHKKPIIVHNGFLDVLHIFDKFVGVIPPDINGFCSEWCRFFTSQTFDTKHIACEGRYTIFNIAENQTTGLQDLRDHLSRKSIISQFAFNEDGDQRLLSSCGETAYNMFLPGDKTTRYSPKAHEAGYDAMMTAQVFLMELELFYRAEKGHQKKYLNKHNPEAQESSGFAIPEDWLDHPQYLRFRNKIGLNSISPGHVELSGPVPSSKRKRGGDTSP